MKANCKYCGIEIDRPPSHIKRSKNIFCNSLCYGKWLVGKKQSHGHRIKVKCAMCGKILEKAMWQLKKTKNHFCNNKCRGEWRSRNMNGENSPSWKGGPEEYKNRAWYLRNIINGTVRRSTPKGKLNHRMSNSIRRGLVAGKGGKSWKKLVGYNLSDLRSHLERLFKPGMSWENISEWHIDHKIPIAAFNFTKPKHEDFKRCWSLKNLQPLWSKENMKKGAKINKPFQKSLLI